MKHLKTIGLVLLLALAISLPLVTVDAGMHSIAIYTLLYLAAATGWNLFSGYSGYVSLGYASFTGIGAYTMAMICDRWQIQGDYSTFLILPIAGLVAAIFALPMGWVALRTRRVTFVVVTISMMFILQSLAFNLSWWTSGSSGIIFPASVWTGDFYNLPFYYVALGLALFSIFVSWWIRNSKYGLGLLAIRDDEERAAGLGVKTGAFKLSAFVISAFIGGMVGSMFSFYSGNIFPQGAFDPTVNLAIALMAFLGGAGTLAGPVIGALLLEPFQQYLTIEYGSLGLNLIILGSLLLLTVLLLPEGIVTTLKKMAIKRAAKRNAVTVAAPAQQQVLVESRGGETR